jgi:protocatechuate 3,4-dioxygenase beta subunit
MHRLGLALGVMILVGTACAGGGGSTSSAECRPTPGQPAQSSAPVVTQGQSSIQLGPGMEVSANAETIAIALRGQELTVSGVVYGQDCVTPLGGATIHVWQVDSEGDYGPGQNDGGVVCCYLQGTLQTDKNGRYEVQTIVPAHYRGRSAPAHIHFEVVHPSAAGIMTELQFAGDPYLGADDSPAVVVPLLRSGSAARATFDIVLRNS